MEYMGWCIEHHSSEPCSPLYFSVELRWTKDNLMALRFADEAAARQVIKHFMDDAPHRVANHIWG